MRPYVRLGNAQPQCRWYNIPPSASGTTDADAGLNLPSSTHDRQGGHITTASEHDSVPLNFNTFIPSHDPALPNLAAADAHNLAGISKDEAFRNALNAMYWTGYWTAVYHVRVPLSLSLATDRVPSVAAPQTSSYPKRQMMLNLLRMNMKIEMWERLWTNL